MLPLGLLTVGEEAEITEEMAVTRAKAGMSKASSSKAQDLRVEDMGLKNGSTVEMLNNGGNGPLLVKVGNSRIAIARGMAMKIMVRRKN